MALGTSQPPGLTNADILEGEGRTGELCQPSQVRTLVGYLKVLNPNCLVMMAKKAFAGKNQEPPSDEYPTHADGVQWLPNERPRAPMSML